MKKIMGIILSMLLCTLFLIVEIQTVWLALKSDFTFIQFNNRHIAMSMSMFMSTVSLVMLTLSLTMLGFRSAVSFIAILFSSIVTMIGSIHIIFAKSDYGYITPLIISIVGIILVCIIYTYYINVRNSELKLKESIMTDSLTGIGNRACLMEQLKTLAKAKEPFYLMFLDLDNFKKVNDTLGHHMGDALLIEVASTWKSIAFSDNFKVFRLGGDEFAVILKVDNKIKASVFAEKLINTIKKNEFICTLDCNVTTSIGIAKYPEDSDNYEMLLTDADAAMYKCKSCGKNNFKFFTKELGDQSAMEDLIESYLERAIATEKWELVYQPQFDSKTHKLVGAEALSRLKIDGEYVSPELFIHIAEKSRLIYDLEMLIYKAAFTNVKPYLKENKNFILSVNVSGKHLEYPKFLDDFIRILEETGFPPANLKVEITESSFIKSNSTTDIVKRIKDYGIKIALDDFGEGYSSIKYLYRFPFDTLKIDKYFIDNMCNSDKDLKLVSIIINIAKIFDCDIIAEGVESEKQLKQLKNLECDYIQGFLWGKPKPIEEVFDKK